ncbi:hypothetical protein BV22DRAFT_832013 [Leucogyrophana mollusca]|uniref:Uncharacterized protein n=1 Tax=Leucogyrophana mollusca TaxID=85980 RepID=A0ACB8B2U0_9AGAM|nr:hypothetical protein BV22DRAFT_832013 [Leucogyrophana mollusca]
MCIAHLWDTVLMHPELGLYFIAVSVLRVSATSCSSPSTVRPCVSSATYASSEEKTSDLSGLYGGPGETLVWARRPSHPHSGAQRIPPHFPTRLHQARVVPTRASFPMRERSGKRL